MEWKDLTEEQKKACYDSYVSEMIYEWGDKAKYLSFIDWCVDSEMLGEALI